jgi:hypothetical protein
MAAHPDRKLATERDGDPGQGLEANAFGQAVFDHRHGRLADSCPLAESGLRLERAIACHSDVAAEVDEHPLDGLGLFRQSVWHAQIASRVSSLVATDTFAAGWSSGRYHPTEMVGWVALLGDRGPGPGPTPGVGTGSQVRRDTHCYHRALVEREGPLA